MAKKKKAAKRTTAKRATAKRAKKRASTKPAASRRVGASGAGDMFNPSGWFSTLIGSQSGRVIMAEALVAAAGAAAAVLVASRTETGAKAGRALMKAGRDGTDVMKEAARSAAAAAGDVIAKSATGAIENLATFKLGSTAGQVVGAMAKSMMGQDEPSQHDLAEKALRMKARKERDNDDTPDDKDWERNAPR